MSIVPFDHQKWPSLYLSSRLLKWIEIDTEVSINHALFMLLKSGFYLLLFANGEKKKVFFPPISRVFMIVPYSCIFFCPFFLVSYQERKPCLISFLISFLNALSIDNLIFTLSVVVSEKFDILSMVPENRKKHVPPPLSLV